MVRSGWARGSVGRAVLAAALAVSGGAQTRQDVRGSQARLAEQVRYRLVMLPYYGVFDNLAFRIDGVDTVVLMGQVTRPTLKSDAERTVKRIEGVGKVEKRIGVLPLSSSDDNLRIRAYRAIFGKPGLDRYAMMAVPPMHIVVKNGHITLVGIVATEADQDLAGLAASGVPLSFGVSNNLGVEKGEDKRE